MKSETIRTHDNRARQISYPPLEELIDLIDEPNRTICNKFLQDTSPQVYLVPGSNCKHQAWMGGYIDHITQMMQWLKQEYQTHEKDYSPHFSLSDALLTSFLHDLEKPYRYVVDLELLKLGHETCWTISPELQNKQETVPRFVEQKINEYKFQLTPNHTNAIQYVEGEIGCYSPTKRIQKPLAAFIHLADTRSARILYDQPTKESGMRSYEFTKQFIPPDIF